MSSINVRTDSGALSLHKSESLVGLRTTTAGVPVKQATPVLPDLGGFQVVSLVGEQDIDAALDAVRQRVEIAVGTHVYFAGNDNRPVVPTGLLYLRLAPGVGEEEAQAVLDLLHLRLVERREDGSLLLAVTEESRNPLRVAADLQALAMVDSAIPDLDVPLDQYFAEPRDGLFREEWYLDNHGSVPGVPNFPLRPGADARIRAAWNRLGNLGSADVVIAVIDNGFDLEHPDLANKAVEPLTIASNAPTVPRGAAYGDHATPCASVALAPANGSGIVGAAPMARLMPLHGLTYSSYLTERMFAHCAQRGADIISCSWGTIDPKFRPGTYHERAIRKAATEGRGGRGCIVLFAAGNEGKNYLNYYCNIPGVIAVGASTSNDTHPAYSNTGPGLSVVAPSDGGWPVLAARASWDTGMASQPLAKRYYVDGRDRGPHYKHFGGTSSATPLVAGICALLLSANPALTSTQVKDILERTAEKIGDRSAYNATGYSSRFGYGRVNADRAVGEALRLRDRPGSPGVTTAPASPARAGFGLQVSALSGYENALRLSRQLEADLHLPTRVVTSGSGPQGLYKVIVGAFLTSAAARQEIPRLQAAGYRPFLRDLSALG